MNQTRLACHMCELIDVVLLLTTVINTKHVSILVFFPRHENMCPTPKCDFPHKQVGMLKKYL